MADSIIDYSCSSSFIYYMGAIMDLRLKQELRREYAGRFFQGFISKGFQSGSTEEFYLSVSVSLADKLINILEQKEKEDIKR